MFYFGKALGYAGAVGVGVSIAAVYVEGGFMSVVNVGTFLVLTASGFMNAGIDKRRFEAQKTICGLPE